MHFIGFGSFSEYGKTTICKETDLEKPNNEYGLAKYMYKLVSEAFCDKNNYKWTWIRPCYVYGKQDVETRLIPTTIKACLDGKNLELNSCDSVVDYLYIEDFVRAISSLITTGMPGVFNICSGKTYVIKDIVNTIKIISGSKSQITFNADKDRKSFSKYICGNNDKLLKSIGWYPTWNLEEGLQDIIGESN